MHNKTNIKMNVFRLSEVACRVVFWQQLQEDYSKEMSIEDAKALAMLVVSFLNGNGFG